MTTQRPLADRLDIDSHAVHPIDRPARRPYAVVADDHPWAEPVQALREAIRLGPVAPPDARIQAELKGVRQPDGRWTLERAYWSIQQRDATAAGGLLAYTLSADLRPQAPARLDWLRLPHDPYLSEMANWLAATPAGAGLQILRYVPLRRLTFRLRHAGGRVAIGKFKRRSRYAQAYGLLGLIDEAAQRQAFGSPVGEWPQHGYRVSAPIALKPQQALYFQTCLPGEDLAEQVTPANATGWIEGIAQRHARLQQLDVPTLALRSIAHWQAQARTDLAWIGWMRPDLVDPVARLAEAVGHLPDPDDGIDGPVGFCHGDFVCSQFLVGADPTWSITDFDLAHRGDPLRDLGILLASLSQDVPALARDAAQARPQVDHDALTEACLGARARALSSTPESIRQDARRLRWHRLCAEIYHLGLALKKDTLEPVSYGHRLDRALRLAGDRAWS
ncbi:aminoglycoside phosphotransferase family protein [Sphaerotilus mobilis]|uniref:Phosphotransferase family enzyme n=1 Tax=Sphaerotilus mobilis TaxID=47994 RepID=A0A4Q7LQC7_9BURK|nr:aminoglycoside phosphotransferase family protein [Sphaerotilus mobilis]RZS56834.1 phosphotransferase family enzyme [Sphaerotilus mobilis]